VPIDVETGQQLRCLAGAARYGSGLEGSSVKCPFCQQDNDRVIDSRSAANGEMIRRRRECLACGRRYTTYEVIEQTQLRVIKKDGSRVPFERERILAGILKACEKRPVSMEKLEAIVTDIERDLYQSFEREVPVAYIGEAVMRHLKDLDKVAYVRFASVYRDFQDMSDFQAEIERISGAEATRPGPTEHKQ